MNSVCVATYNGEPFIEQQLRSILAQIADDDEVIISDDGSTDRTLEIIGSIGDKRIRVVHSTAHYFRDNFANALAFYLRQHDSYRKEIRSEAARRNLFMEKAA